MTGQLKMNKALRILHGILLIALAVHSMLIAELSAEMRVVAFYYDDWLTGAILYRLGILFILYLGFITLLGKVGKSTKIASILVLSFLLIDSFILPTDRKHFFGLFFDSHQPIVSYTLISLFFMSTMLHLRSNNNSLRKKWLYVALILPSIGLSAIKVVYIEDWSTTNIPPKKAINYKEIRAEAEKTDSLQLKEKEAVLIPFFSTSCGFCRLASMKMGISYKNGSLPKTVLLFPGKDTVALANAEAFMKETGTWGLPYQMLEKNTFVRLGGHRLPSIFYVSPDRNEHWTGECFNYPALSSVCR